MIRFLFVFVPVDGRSDATQVAENVVMPHYWPVFALARCGRPPFHSTSLHPRLSHKVLSAPGFCSLNSGHLEQYPCFSSRALNACCAFSFVGHGQFGCSLRAARIWFHLLVVFFFFSFVFRFSSPDAGFVLPACLVFRITLNFGYLFYAFVKHKLRWFVLESIAFD